MEPLPSFSIGQRVLSPESPYIAAEIGVNHNGDLDLALRTMDAAASAGADAVKFQAFRAEEFMADPEHLYEYESGGKTIRESMYDMFKRLELPESWHTRLQEHAAELGVEVLASAADPLSADILKGLGHPAIKLASEDLINLPLLQHVGGLEVPVIVSTGMGDEREIEVALETLRDAGAKKLLLLHCVSLYPTPDDEVHLERIPALQERFGVPVGYSDHSLGIEAAVGAAALGAIFIEKHFTLDRTLPGPDHALSSDPVELKRLVDTVHRVAKMRGDRDLSISPGEHVARRQFRRSIVASRDLDAGTVLKEDMLVLKRPGTGLHPIRLPDVLGRRLTSALRANDQIVRTELDPPLEEKEL